MSDARETESVPDGHAPLLCPCGAVDDSWCAVHSETGHPGCATCGQHHRRPLTCKDDDRG